MDRPEATAERGRRLLDLARARLRDWDPSALAAARRGLELVSESGSPRAADMLTLAHACAAQRLPEAIGHYRRAARRAYSGEDVCAAACGEARALEALGRADEAAAAAAAAEAWAAEHGIPARRAEARWTRLRVRLATCGPAPEALSELGALVRCGPAAEWSGLAEVDLAVALADAGRAGAAQRALDRACAGGPAAGAVRQAATWARAELDWLAGRSDRAAAVAQRLVERWPDSPIRPSAEVTLAWARLDGGACDWSTDEWRSRADRLAGRLLREELRCLLGAAHVAAGAGMGEAATWLRGEVRTRAAAAGLAALAERAQ